MEYDTRLAAEYAGAKLDKLVNRAHRDTLAVVDRNDIPTIVKHYAALRTEYDALSDKVAKLKAEVDDLSHNIIPSTFRAQGVPFIKVDGVGRVSVSVRWNGSIIDKPVGMDWLRSTGNEGLIIETVNAQTLGAFAKTVALEGKPLPDNIFNVTQTNITSITKG